MASKFKVGDRVRLTPEGRRKYGGVHRYSDRVYIVEMSRYDGEGTCVFNDSRSGWIHDGLGINECFELATHVRRGGE